MQSVTGRMSLQRASRTAPILTSGWRSSAATWMHNKRLGKQVKSLKLCRIPKIVLFLQAVQRSLYVMSREKVISSSACVHVPWFALLLTWPDGLGTTTSHHSTVCMYVSQLAAFLTWPYRLGTIGLDVVMIYDADFSSTDLAMQAYSAYFPSSCVC